MIYGAQPTEQPVDYVERLLENSGLHQSVNLTEEAKARLFTIPVEKTEDKDKISVILAVAFGIQLVGVLGSILLFVMKAFMADYYSLSWFTALAPFCSGLLLSAILLSASLCCDLKKPSNPRLVQTPEFRVVSILFSVFLIMGSIMLTLNREFSNLIRQDHMYIMYVTLGVLMFIVLFATTVMFHYAKERVAQKKSDQRLKAGFGVC